MYIAYCQINVNFIEERVPSDVEPVKSTIPILLLYNMYVLIFIPIPTSFIQFFRNVADV